MKAHVDVKVHYLRDLKPRQVTEIVYVGLVHDGHVKLVKCAGTQNVFIIV